jgi:hypothetical protein
MRISLADRSLYYKGLMLLIRKDREIHDEEKNLMMCIGKILGFESVFCANAIDEIMDNKYIIDSPPLFSEPGIARCFLRDGLRLSASDGQTHKAELDWLKSVAENNDLGPLWDGELDKFYLDHCPESRKNSLDLEHFEWE